MSHKLIALIFSFCSTFGLVNNYYAADNMILAANETSKNTIKEFNKHYEMIFVYSSSCGYCFKFAPIFREFTDSNKIKVQAVTVNGETLPAFKNAKHDRDILTKYNISGIPAVVIVKKNNGKGFVFSEGSMSRNALENRLQAFIDETLH